MTPPTPQFWSLKKYRLICGRCDLLLEGACGLSWSVGEITPWGEILINVEENQQISLLHLFNHPSQWSIQQHSTPYMFFKKIFSQTRQLAVFAILATSLPVTVLSASSPFFFPPPFLGLHWSVGIKAGTQAVFSRKSRKSYWVVLHKNYMNIMIKHDSPKLVNACSGPFVIYNQLLWKDWLVLICS